MELEHVMNELERTGDKVKGYMMARYGIKTAEDLVWEEDKNARWVGKDALRELRSEKVKARSKD